MIDDVSPVLVQGVAPKCSYCLKEGHFVRDCQVSNTHIRAL